MTTYTLIKRDGSREEVPFLLQNGQPYVSPHIAKYEVDDNWTGEVMIFEPVISCFEEARRLLGRPIGINSGYRTEAYQKHLKEIGYKAATYSPHCRGAALDLAIPTGTTYLALVTLFKQAAKNLGLPKPRFGYKAYGYTFVHFDLVFMLFTPFFTEKNPRPNEWWEGAEW
jgi:hypothetical protein